MATRLDNTDLKPTKVKVSVIINLSNKYLVEQVEEKVWQKPNNQFKSWII